MTNRECFELGRRHAKLQIARQTTMFANVKMQAAYDAGYDMGRN